MTATFFFEPKPWLALFQTNLPLLRENPSVRLSTPSADLGDDSCEEEPKESLESSFSVLSLPPEVLTAICSLLEPEQLSNLAQVSKRFLPYTYDPAQWRRIALRTWPFESAKELENRLYIYKSWRKLCTKRPRLRTNGIYVVRHQFAKTASRVAVSEPLAPVFLVTYHRFLRFYPDGTVVSLTTPEPPERSFHRVRRFWKPTVQDRDKAHPSIGRYELDEETMQVTLSLPMRQPKFPNMRSGTVIMQFSLSQTKPGAYDRLFLVDHYAIMDHDEGDPVQYSPENFDGKPFRMIPIWGFRHKIYQEFPRDDQNDLAQWYEMKRQARKAQQRASNA